LLILAPESFSSFHPFSSGMSPFPHSIIFPCSHQQQDEQFIYSSTQTPSMSALPSSFLILATHHNIS